MIGGTVLEVCDVPKRRDVLYVNVMDSQSGLAKRQECAILLEKNKDSLKIQMGDSIWWQSGWAMWTPQDSRGREDDMLDRQGKAWDVRIPKIGPSGIRHPFSVANCDEHDHNPCDSE